MMFASVCSLPVVSVLFSACLPPPPLATGYVEGEFVLVAPVATARIEQMEARRGDVVNAGQILAVLEHRDAEIARAEAGAALRGAEARLGNLREGMREEEIRVIEAKLASARAQAAEAEIDLARAADLVARGVAAQAQLDETSTRLDIANAQVAEIEANLAVARLPARSYEIAAAEAVVNESRARLEAAEWQLEKRTLTAASSGIVHEVLRTAGEIAGPQAPVLSMLPDGAVFIRLYLPETALSQVRLGTELKIGCDGCSDDARALVTFVSDEPEFTPPVIYSLENRQKLVYLIEARPAGDTSALKPGQIVDATLAEANG